MELAIDTSTRVASLALASRGALIAEITWYAGQNHTVELIPNMISLLRQRKAHVGDIESIVVAKGPGSFNGLRVALATAKGLAFALGIHLVGISTLEVLAFPYAEIGFPVCPILNAGGGEVATALFQTRDGRWERLTAEHITTTHNLCSQIKRRTIFCGEISDEQWVQLNRQLGEKALIARGATVFRRAGYLAELGWKRIESDDFDDPLTLQPLYLKSPTISKKRRYDAVSNMQSAG